MDTAQGQIQEQPHQSADAAVRLRAGWRHRHGLHAPARVHGCRSRLPARQCGIQPRQQDGRGTLCRHVPEPVRSDLERPRKAGGRDRADLRAHRLGLPRELTREHLFPDALQHLQRVPRRHRRRRPAQRPHGLPGHPDLEQAVQLPERCCHRDHQQAGNLQRLHPCRQRRLGQDLHRTGRHQVLRAAQPVSAGALPQEAGG